MSTLRLLLCLSLVFQLSAGEVSPARLFKEARKAEQAGQFAKAYLLYSQAAALEPHNLEYWARGQATRTRALLEVKPKPRALTEAELEAIERDEDDSDAPAISTRITDVELLEARKPQPPLELDGNPGKLELRLKGDSKQLFEQVAAKFGLDVIFDGDYQPTPPLRFEMEPVTFREALRSLEAATGSFTAPISRKIFLVAKDTQQKRAEVEPTVTVAFSVPDYFELQEFQEVARAVQQVMEVQKFSVDSANRMVLLRDRVSKVRPLQQLFEQLLYPRAQVMVEMEFLDASKLDTLSWGLRLPTTLSLSFLGQFGGLNVIPSIPAGVTQMLTFGGGATLFGVTLVDAQILAQMSRSSGSSLLKTTVRSSAGKPATFHVGERYPILASGYLGGGVGTDDFHLIPSFNFEDLGLKLKVTPWVHDTNEVSLELEAEFKVLTGQSLNGLPVISQRQFKSAVRLRDGEWAVVAGLMSASEVRAFSGLPGVSEIPFLGALLRRNDRERAQAETLLLLKPKIVSLPASEAMATRGLWVGSETRPLSPM